MGVEGVRDGNVGGGAMIDMRGMEGGGVVPFAESCRRGVDLEAERKGLRPAYLRASASLSSLVRLGGRAGRVEGSYSGARMRFRSDCEVMDVPFDSAEMEDMAVVTELRDSFDSRRLRVEKASEGRLGGRAGEG